MAGQPTFSNAPLAPENIDPVHSLAQTFPNGIIRHRSIPMVLVTEATSFIGRAVVGQLAAEGQRVCCQLRPDRWKQRLPVGVPFSIVSASADDLPALRTAMHGVTTVIHLVGREHLYPDDSLGDHVMDTANLVGAMQESGVRRLVYLSRAGASLESTSRLFQATSRAEEVVRESGLDYTILRVPIVYGPEDHSTNLVVMIAKIIPLWLPLPSANGSCFRPLWVGDLARCVMATPDHADLVGQTISLGGPQQLHFEQMVVQILAAAGIRRRRVALRITAVRRAVRLLDSILPYNPIPAWWLDLLTTSEEETAGSISRYFGFEPRRFDLGIGYLSQRRPWRRDLLRLIQYGP